MPVLVDTNVLLRLSDPASPHHLACAQLLDPINAARLDLCCCAHRRTILTRLGEIGVSHRIDATSRFISVTAAATASFQVLPACFASRWA